jgi:hypothetical protein
VNHPAVGEDVLPLSASLWNVGYRLAKHVVDKWVWLSERKISGPLAKTQPITDAEVIAAVKVGTWPYWR